MAAGDPYSPCPCGSGQKFKWCCHKVEAQVERAQRLFEGRQVDAAIHAVDDALRKHPGSPWLLMRKAVFLLSQERLDDARAALEQLLEKSPKHPGALALLSRIVIESEGASAGVAQLQRTLSSMPAGSRPGIGRLVTSFGIILAQQGLHASALYHLRLGARIAGQAGDDSAGIRAIERNHSVSLWLRNPYTLEPAPADLAGEARSRFDQALAWADEGLLSAAASAFEVLSAHDGPGTAVIERNLGLCRVWLADNDGAVATLRRAIAGLGESEEAVDLEGLCQSLEMPGPDDMVELVRLSWPLRDRERLLNSLRADSTIDDDLPGPLDPDAEDSPQVERFGLLDRPRIERTQGLRIEDLPRYVGRVFVGPETAGIEALDDGRLDGLIERFTELAEGAIPPAHPKTTVVDHIARPAIALSWEWQTPDDLPQDEESRLDREQAKHVFEEIWPASPMPYLNGRTPLDAAGGSGARVALRAAILQQERSHDHWNTLIDFGSVRAKLGLEPEPEIDPATVDVERVHLSRLALIPADRLDDARLAALFHRARRFVITEVVEAAGLVLERRPDARQGMNLQPSLLYSELASAAAALEKRDEAFAWIEKGRKVGTAEEQARRAPQWDMLALQLRVRFEPPETWVPELAVIMDRYQGNEQASTAITMGLIELGLIRMVPSPDDPADMMLDSRLLQMMMAQYGPRVTTASGGLGVSAARGEIWTPGAASGGGGGGIWTPGSEAGRPPGEEAKPRLIIPGR